MFRTVASCSANLVRAPLRSGRSAEAVEQDKEEHGDEGVDERGGEQVQSEPGFRLRQQDAAGQSNRRLMNNEKPCGEGKSRRGMFGWMGRWWR